MQTTEMNASKPITSERIRTFLSGIIDEARTQAAAKNDLPTVQSDTPAQSRAENPSNPPALPRAPGSLVQTVLLVLGGIAFLYFARPVILPVVLACVAGTSLKPVMQWLSRCHIPAPLAAAVVVGLFVAAIGTGFIHLSRPAVAWMNEAPRNMAQLGQRVQKIFRPAAQIGQVAAAVNNLG